MDHDYSPIYINWTGQGIDHDDAMASTMKDAMDTRGHGVIRGQGRGVDHGRCHGPCHGRRLVYELYHGTVHGPGVGAMEHAMAH